MTDGEKVRGMHEVADISGRPAGAAEAARDEIDKIRQKRMITISAYAIGPVSVAGLRAVLERETSFEVLGIFTRLDELEARLVDARRKGMPARLALLELSAELTLDEMKRVADIDPRTGIVLWFDEVASEYLSQAVGLGARGILSRKSSIETHLECLKSVAEGNSWIDHEAMRRIASTSQVALSPRERHVTGLIAQGLSNKEIAWSLGITEGTVKVYVSKLFDKAGVSDRFELAILALRNLQVNHTAESTPLVSPGGDKIQPLAIPAFLRVERRLAPLAPPANSAHLAP